MSDDKKVDSIERLKTIIIEHVAKDVLLLSESVDGLNTGLLETKELIKQITDDANGYFDNMAEKVIELLTKQEEHLQSVAEQRTTQVEMNISDRVAKILNDEFKNYTDQVKKAVDDLNAITNNTNAEYTKQVEKATADLNQINDDINSKLETANKAAIDNLKNHFQQAKEAMEKLAEQGDGKKNSVSKLAVFSLVASSLSAGLLIPVLIMLIKIVY